MAQISRQIGWGTESNLLYQILKQLNKLTSILFNLKESTVPKYKVYTALLTQTGGDDLQAISSGDLTIGITYSIAVLNTDADFTNVGAPNNNNGTSFVATGTTPNSWGTDGNLKFNTGAPVVTVLENTIGNIWFEYLGVGDYYINSDNLFINSKTFSIIGTGFENIVNNNVTGLVYSGPTLLSLQTGIIITVPVVLLDDLLFNTPIEIRVYS